MEINITKTATEKISERTKGQSGYLKLKYDTEGCGCAVDGIAALWFVPELEEDDLLIETNDKSIYVEKAKTVFFDELMTIDFSHQSNSFMLKSPNQIINGRMSLIIKKAD